MTVTNPGCSGVNRCYGEEMEVHLTADQEFRLGELASRTGRASEQLVSEAIERMLDYEAWFVREVEAGLAQLDRGEFVEHGEVLARFQQRFAK